MTLWHLRSVPGHIFCAHSSLAFIQITRIHKIDVDMREELTVLTEEVSNLDFPTIFIKVFALVI